ncbi:tripartite motif-containing protein 44-like [Penaeus vannamei]|uniref:tripartite motif-containing protein 44-like n=1 Tax=Penaeus vannamei TaxID=6689 RepID=UPI00387FB17D
MWYSKHNIAGMSLTCSPTMYTCSQFLSKDGKISLFASDSLPQTQDDIPIRLNWTIWRILRHRRWRWCWPSRCWCRPLGPVASGEEEAEEEAVEAEVEATTAADTTEATMEEEVVEETTVETTTAEPVEGSEEEVVEVTTEEEDSEAAGDLEADPEEDSEAAGDLEAEEDSEAAGDLEADPEEDSEAAGDLEADPEAEEDSEAALVARFLIKQHKKGN